jgi:hypothetical protein
MRNPFSNAPEGWPDTTDSGLPLYYPIGGDGLPDGAPRLVYDSQTFADEAEVETYKRRAKARDENLEAWAKAWAAEIHTGLFPAETITQEEAWHLRQVSMRKGDWIWYFACSGSNVAINRLKNDSFYNPAPEGWKFTPRDNHRFVNVPELWEE